MSLLLSFSLLVQYVLPAHALDGSPQTAQSTSILGALGTIVGYLGAEVAPDDLFERLLWPQRFYNDFNLRNSAKVGFLMPMGGPLHRAALSTLDACLINGLLLRGLQSGNMLGTAFFADRALTYSIHNPTRGGAPEPTELKAARNAFWATVVEQLPPTYVAQPGDPETSRPGIVRARTAVNLLTIRYAEPDEVESSRLITCDTGPLNMRCLAGIIFTEITGIVVGALVLGLWRSWFCVLWWLPAILKAISALWTIPRESLTPRKAQSVNQPNIPAKDDQSFELHGLKRGFLLIRGEPGLVQQFFRHYGHPVRHRFRELVQLGIIIGFCFLFPLGLLCSLVWMSVELQYLWLGYQLYATVAMHIYRYSNGRNWATTGETAAFKLCASSDEVIYFRDEAGTTVMVRNSRTEVDNVREAKKVLGRLLGENKIPEKSLLIQTSPLVAIGDDLKIDTLIER